MTTYSAHYILSAHEIPIYRRLLENWTSIATGEFRKIAERLLHNTYSATGEPLTIIEESMRIEQILPFLNVMSDELERMMTIHEENRKLPPGERDTTIYSRVDLLQTVIEKIRGDSFSRYR